MMTRQILLLTTILLFSLESYANFKICIHAKVHDGMANAILHEDGVELAKTRKLIYKLFGDRIAGHASLEIKKNGQTIRSYGYWPDDNLKINHDHVDKSSTGAFEYNGLKIQSRVASQCYPVTFSQVETIEQRAKAYKQQHGEWSALNNCVRFAAQVFRQITGMNLDTNLPLPGALYRAISQKPNHIIYDSTSEIDEVVDPSVSQ